MKRHITAESDDDVSVSVVSVSVVSVSEVSVSVEVSEDVSELGLLFLPADMPPARQRTSASEINLILVLPSMILFLRLIHFLCA